MMNRRSILLYAITLAVVSNCLIPSHQAQTFGPPAQAAPPATPVKCQPRRFWAELFVAGLYYAVTKSPSSFVREYGCPPAKQAPRPNAQAKQETPADGSLANMPAVEVMRLARLLYIQPRSSWFDREKLERELMKRREFGELGLEITRKLINANLVLEITRKKFTTRFTCSVIEPFSERVVGSTTASSLGGEIEPHLAEAIIKQFKAARSEQGKRED
jgi:hypothetical protein